jgi:signal transduction histidine kinase
MRTPSLRRRITATSAVVLVLVLLAMDVFLYLTLRAHLEAALDDVLDTRIAVAVRLSEQVSVPELATALTGAGVPATVRGLGGDQFIAAPAVPRIGQYVPPAVAFHPRVQRTAALPSGGTVTVYASRAGIDRTLRRLLLLELAGTGIVVGLAVVLIGRTSRRALAPLQQVIDTAKRTEGGTPGLRLRPDRLDTELGQMAAAYDRMLDALEAALDRSRRSDERNQRFLADAAHQLRTPITRIRTTVESLFRAESPKVHDRLLTTLVRETGRASRLLSALLRIARLDKGDPPTCSPVDLADLCRAEVERAEPFAPHLRFEFEAQNPPMARLDVDAQGIREAVSNLLDNARRHATHKISVKVGSTRDTVRIEVADDGPGVAVPERELIFERFASLDDMGGSGLGLPIARGVARAHGGDLVYTGTAFVLSLPPPPGSQSAPPPGPESSSTST